MADCLYTKDELISKIKEIDLELNSGVTRSELDTGQSKHSFSVSTAQLQRQKEYYLKLLKVVDPACYHSIMGPSTIRFKGPSC